MPNPSASIHSRRSILGASCCGALLAAAAPSAASAERLLPSFTPSRKPGTGMPGEGPDTPRLCLNFSTSQINPAGIDRFEQLGITHVNLLAGNLPWVEAALVAQVEAMKARGLVAGVGRLPNPIMTTIALGGPGRDQAIEDMKTTIRSAGKAGIPVLQYALYAHRLDEAYFTAPDPERGNARLLSFDYQSAKDLPPLAGESVHSHEELWANAVHFIKEVIPVAEASNVRLAHHPNDAPGYVSRGSHQIMSTLEDWKKFITIVDSPCNGIVFDCGISREIGEDPIAVARYFGERDRINHVHYRNVIMRTPREFYTETYPDMGDNQMFAIMKELVRLKYNRLIFPEHARGLDVDRENKDDDYAAWAFQVGYTRAMLQAALAER